MDKRKTLWFSYSEAFFSSLMIGAGESFFAAYALSQGMGEVLAGFVVGLPMMLGAGLQTLTPTLFARWARPKRWTMLMATLQGLTLVGLAATTQMSSPVLLVFLLIGLYWGFYFAGSTIWNYWMGFVVPTEFRAEFYARRMRLIQYGVIAGLFVSGFWLQSKGDTTVGAEAYLWPFLCAFLSRMTAVLFLSRQAPVQIAELKRQARLNLREFFAKIGRVFQQNPRARSDLTFLFLFYVAIYISSPFVAPFLLAQRRFDYLSFMAAQMALFLGKIFALLLAQGWIRRWGVRPILFWGAIGMSPLPALWGLIEHTFAATLLQALSGFSWGLFEVAVGLVLFAEYPHDDKIQLLTWNQFLQTLAILVGTLIGGQMLHLGGEAVSAYIVIFVLGSACRLALVLAHRPKILMNSR